MLFLLSGAFALDCTGLDTEICDAVNQISLDINAQTGTSTISDTSPRVRLRPATLYTKLLEVKSSLPAAENCSVTGYASGTYAGDGSSEGRWRDFDTTNGTFDGMYVRAGRRFEGSFSGDASGRIGNGFGSYNKNRQMVGNWSGDFIAGVFARSGGTNGVFVSLLGSCTGLITDGLDPWYGGPLAATVEPLRIFVTTPYDALLDPRPFIGLAGLDARCQLEADAVFGVGQTTFVAGVSDVGNGIDSADQRPEMEPGRPLVQAVNGRWLGVDVVGFFNRFVTSEARVNVTADGVTFEVDAEDPLPENVVWWGDYGTSASASPPMAAPGPFGFGDCGGWFDGTDSSGVIGGVPANGGIRLARFGATCDLIQGRSYCVEVD